MTDPIEKNNDLAFLQPAWKTGVRDRGYARQLLPGFFTSYPGPLPDLS